MSRVIPIAYFDPPLVLDCTVTNIPGSGSLPLQVISNTGLDTGVGIDFSDSTGDFIGAYIGLPGLETLLCIIGNGLSGQAWARIPAGSRISLRSMTIEPITAGLIYAVVTSV